MDLLWFKKVNEEEKSWENEKEGKGMIGQLLWEGQKGGEGKRKATQRHPARCLLEGNLEKKLLL